MNLLDIVKLIFGLLLFGALLCAVYYSTKLYAKNQTRFTSSKYMRILDKLSVGKDSGLAIVQIGNQYFLASLSSSKVEVVRELNKEELVELKAEGYQAFETNPMLKKMIDVVYDKGKIYIIKIKEQIKLRRNKNTPNFQEILKSRLGGKQQVVKKDSQRKTMVVDELLAESISKTKKIKSRINIDEGANNDENQ